MYLSRWICSPMKKPSCSIKRHLHRRTWAGPWSRHRPLPAKAVFKKTMAAVTEREYGDRVGIWRIIDLFDRHQLKATMLMNGLKVEQFADACKEIKSKDHEFSSESYEHEYSYM